MYLLPKPKTIKEQDGQMLLCHSTHIVMTKEVAETEMHAAKRLQEAIRQETGLILPFSVGEVREGDLSLGIAKTLPEQTYEITIDEKGGQISGGDGAGVLYGVETFCQIVQQCGGILPCVQIQDAPDMPNRGYYFDQTRGRVLKLEELKKIADRMCRYKLNQLQLYVEHTYLFRDFSEMWRDQTPLTAEEIRELDSYCRERHIELVPSLASFGHLCTLLSTKTYGDLCEMEDSWKEPFSFWNRMRYHTINVSDERSLPLIKKMIAEYEDAERDSRHDSERIYGLNLHHKHLPEMEYVCGLMHAPVFVPIVGDFYKGMATTVMLPGVDAHIVHNTLAEHYANQNFVTVAPIGGDENVIYANTMAGRDSLRLIVCGHEEQTIVTALFDNLGKGASGAAVQNMNIMLGLEETTGLTL